MLTVSTGETSIAVQVLLSTRVRGPSVDQESTGAEFSGHIIERLVGTGGPLVIRHIVRHSVFGLRDLFGERSSSFEELPLLERIESV